MIITYNKDWRQKNQGALVKKSQWLQEVWGDGGMKRQSTSSETILYGIVTVNTSHKPLKTHRMRNTKDKPECKLWTWVIRICQCRLINWSKYTTLEQHAESGGGCASVRAGGIWEISAPSAQFWCEPKFALKIKFYFFFKSLTRNNPSLNLPDSIYKCHWRSG